jgi:hypothetical protein
MKPLLIAITVVLLAPAAQASATTFNVNPATGKDSNAGTATKPLKTLTRAVKLARSGDIVSLAPGKYNAAGGEQYPVAVRSGVTVQGSGVRPLLDGDKLQASLVLQGDATIRNLKFLNFTAAIRADRGTQTLSQLIVQHAGFELNGTARATLAHAAFEGVDDTAVAVRDTARLTFNEGSFFGTGVPSNVDCDEARGVVASGSAQVSLTSVRFESLAAGAVAVSGGATATLDHAAVRSNINGTCTVAPSLRASDSARLTVQQGDLFADELGTGTARTLFAIDSTSNATLSVRDTTIRNYKRSGISAAAQSPVSVSGSTIEAVETGIEAAKLTLRGTTVRNAIVGVAITGPLVDLGQPGFPGGNTFAGNLDTGVRCRVTCAVFAVGNTWNPNVQAADLNGRYTGNLLVNGLSPFAQGRNFRLQPFSTSAIQL